MIFLIYIGNGSWAITNQHGIYLEDPEVFDDPMIALEWLNEYMRYLPKNIACDIIFNNASEDYQVDLIKE